MDIKTVEWDSDFFNLKVGKYTVSDSEEFNYIEFNKSVSKENYDLVYVIKHNTIISKSDIEKSKLYLMDCQLQVSMPLKRSFVNFEPRNELSNKELIECYNLAEQVSSVARFNNEPLIGVEKTKSLYRKWVDNTINKQYSDCFFLEKMNDKVIGMWILKTDIENKTGQFSLWVVDSDVKRSGIGNKLMEQSYAYWTKQNIINNVISTFSAQNLPSFNFHLKNGFNKIDSIKYIYHYNKNAN